MTLPANLVIEKNRMEQKYPWLLLLKFAINEGDSNEVVHRFVHNFKDVTFQGNLYRSFPFDLGLITQSIDGKIHSTNLSISNVSHLLQPDLEELRGATNAEVTITVVHADNLTEDYKELEMVFDVLSTYIGPLSIEFSLGAPNPLLQRFLTQLYFADFCSYDVFKGPRCKYEGAALFCHRRLVDCRGLGNSARFGGCPGLRKDGVRFV